MKNHHAILCLAALMLHAANAFSQTYYPEEKGRGIEFWTTEDGLEVFLKTDRNSALVRTELSCRAGFSSQTPSTAGFFPMYTELFSRTATKENREILELCSMESQCRADCSTWTAMVPPEILGDYLSALDQCFSDSRFSNADISRVFSKMKEASVEYSSGTTGLINTSIDSRVFGEEPWKVESGVYPGLFARSTPEEIRTVLYSIGDTFFRPRNAALFVSGNITREQLDQRLRGKFSVNMQRRNSPVFEKENTAPVQDSERKFVIVSDAFSEELTQVVVQFKGLSRIQAEVLSAAFNSENSGYIRNSLSSPDLNLRSEDYITAASAQKKNSSRFILQALFEKSAVSPVQQCESFVAIAKESALLSRQELISAQKRLMEQFRERESNSAETMKLLSDFWAIEEKKPGETTEEFLGRFTEYFYSVQKMNEKAIAEKIRDEEPFVFILLDKKSSEKFRQELEENGYSFVTEKNSSWYKNKLLENLAREEKSRLSEKENAGTSVWDESTMNFPEIYTLKNTVSEFTLPNGIPLSVKENTDSGTVSVSIRIRVEDDNRAVLAKAVLKNAGIRNATVTDDWFSTTVSFTVRKEEAETCFNGLSAALIFGEVTPISADRIVSETNYEKLMKDSILSNQMRNNVLAYISRGTEFAGKFNPPAKKKSTSYDDILSSYTKLLDASIYSVAVAGDCQANEIYRIACESFGLLKEHGLREKAKVFVPAFKNKERRIQLTHLFSSDIPAELAPKEVPVLVPTKEFLDPAQIYFTAPAENDSAQIEVYNAILFSMANRMKKAMGTDPSVTAKTTGTDPSVTADPCTPASRFGAITATSLKRTSPFFQSYKTARKEILDDLSDEEKCGKFMKEAKTLWKMNFLGMTQTNEGTALLIQNGMDQGMPQLYFTSYRNLENAGADSFMEILEKYFPADNPVMKASSVDSKK